MLDEVEIEKIKKLIDQGKTDYKIGMILKHSPNTVKEIRNEYKNAKVNHITGEETHFDGSIEGVRGILCIMEDMVKKGKLKIHEKERMEKLMDQQRELLRIEVDERIPDEIAKAVNVSDGKWSEKIQRKYVKKEIAQNLKNSIDAKDLQLAELIRELNLKDNILRRQHSEIHKLKSENTRLMNDNVGFNNDLQNCQEISVLHMEKLNMERGNFEVNKIYQNQDLEAIRLGLVDFFNENHKKALDLEKQKEKVSEWDDALEIKSKKLDKTQREIELEKEHMVKVRAAIEKTKQQQKNTHEKFTVLRPVSFSGQPVLQPGITPMNQSSSEAIVVEYSGEPVIQSGISSVYKSGEEMEVFGPNGKPVSSSGIST